MQGETVSGEDSVHRQLQLDLNFVKVAPMHANKMDSLFIASNRFPESDPARIRQRESR